MKPQGSLSDQDLMAYSEDHLLYEIQMLLCTAAVFGSIGAVRDSGLLAWTFNNATLNSFCLHARNLIDFLYLRDSNRDRPTDIVVQDYIDAAILPRHLPPITPLLEQAKTKADKQAAHLTLDRIDYERSGKRWDFLAIVMDIMTAFRAIAHLFPETKVSRGFREFISQPNVRIPQVVTKPVYLPDGTTAGVSFSLSLCKEGGQDWTARCHLFPM